MKKIPRHDDLCETLGHDALCPDGGLLVRNEKGQFPAKTSGNVYGPRRLRAAREEISRISDGGRLIIERLAILGGLVRDPNNLLHSGSVQVRALIKLAEIYWGKQIRGQVKHTGVVAHVPVPLDEAALAARLARLPDEALRKIDDAWTAIEDAEVTPAEGPGEGGDVPSQLPPVPGGGVGDGT